MGRTTMVLPVRRRSSLARRLVRTDDSGASLIIALIIITVVAIVVGSVLVLSGTNERATVALRDQAADSAAAAGAVQVGINKLRTASNTLANFGCSPDATAAVGLVDVPYPANGTSPGGTAHVTCTTDIDGSETGFLTEPNAGPGSALLALGTSDDALNGIVLADARSGQGGPFSISVDGGVFANTQLNVSGHPLYNVWEQPAPPDPEPANWNPMSWIIARSGLVDSGGNCKNVDRSNSVVYYNCQYGQQSDVRGMDPGLLVPSGTTSYNQTAPSPLGGVTFTTSCYVGSGKDGNVWVVDVKPTNGVAATIDDLAINGSGPVKGLNSYLTPTGNKCNGVPTLVHFEPGQYYVTTTWNVTNSYYVAGTISAAFGSPTNYYQVSQTIAHYYFPPKNDTPPKDMIAASVCVDPQDDAASASSGVELYVAASGQVNINDSGNKYKSNGVQFVQCASSSAEGPPIAIYSPRTIDNDIDPLTNGGCPSCGVQLQGTIYTPRRPVDIYMNNGSSKTVAYGVFAKSISVTVNASGKVAGQALLAGGIPEGGGSPIPVYVFLLTAYVCPGQASCGATGSVALTAKVRVSGYIQRTVTVLSWSTNR